MSVEVSGSVGEWECGVCRSVECVGVWVSVGECVCMDVLIGIVSD